MKLITKTVSLSLLVSLLVAPVVANDSMTEQAFAGLMQLEGQWQGTLAKSDGTSVNLQLNYTSKSNGSALLEESSEHEGHSARSMASPRPRRHRGSPERSLTLQPPQRVQERTRKRCC